MAMYSLGNLGLIELKSFRKKTPSTEYLDPAWLSTVSLMTARRVGIHSPFKVSLEKRFESWCRGANESDVYFESDEDP